VLDARKARKEMKAKQREMEMQRRAENNKENSGDENAAQESDG
jgi:hypothetical protein